MGTRFSKMKFGQPVSAEEVAALSKGETFVPPEQKSSVTFRQSKCARCEAVLNSALEVQEHECPKKPSGADGSSTLSPGTIRMPKNVGARRR